MKYFFNVVFVILLIIGLALVAKLSWEATHKVVDFGGSVVSKQESVSGMYYVCLKPTKDIPDDNCFNVGRKFFEEVEKGDTLTCDPVGFSDRLCKIIK